MKCISGIIVVITACVVLSGCGKSNTGQNQITPISSEQQLVEGDFIQLISYRRTKEWEVSRTPDGGRILPQEAEDGFEYIAIQTEIDTQGDFKEVLFNASNVSASSSDGKVFALSLQDPDISLVIETDETVGTKVQFELPIQVPVGTSINRLEIKSVSFDIK
jgi:hypothetical protein